MKNYIRIWILENEINNNLKNFSCVFYTNFSVSIDNFSYAHKGVVNRSGIISIHWLCDSLNKVVSLFIWNGFQFDNIRQKSISKVSDLFFFWKDQVINHRKESLRRNHYFYFMVSLSCWELFGCDNDWSGKVNNSQKKWFSFSFFKERINLLQYFSREFNKVFFSAFTNVTKTFN